MSTPSSDVLPLLTRPSRFAPLWANWWIPVAIGLLILLAPWIEGGTPYAGVHWDKFWARITMLIGINLTLAVSLQLINGIAGQFSLGHAGFMAVGAYMGGYAVTAHGAAAPTDGDAVPWMNPGGALLFVLAVLLVTAVSGLIAYGLYRAVRLLARLHPKGPVAFMWLLLAWLALDVMLKTKGVGGVGGGPASNPLGAINLLGLTIKTIGASFTFLLDHSSPLAALLTNSIPASLRKPSTLIVSLLGGGTAAAIIGFVVGLPTLRLRGDYLAIATLGVSELIRTAITNSEPLGRATGFSVSTFAVEADASDGTLATYYFPWVYGVALLTILIVWRIQHSPKGRALQCLREDEIASSAVGIDVTGHKVMAFVIGAFLAGLGGSLFAHYDGYMNPKQFDMQRSIELVVMVTLGGLGSVPGTIIACLLLTLLQPTLQTSEQWMPHWMPHWTLSITSFANQYRLVIYAMLLILAMLARSRGWLNFRSRGQATLAGTT